MKARLASIAFLIACAATGLTWLSFQPLLIRLLRLVQRGGALGASERRFVAHLQAILPVQLGIDLVLVGAFTLVVLYWMVAKPLEQTERQVAQLETLGADLPDAQRAGPLLARLQSALRRAREGLKEAQSELVASERLATVGKLAAGVAHEIGNPLSGILGYLSLARQRATAGDPELTEFLNRIDDEVHRIDGIVRGLLELGRPASGAMGPVDVASVIRTSAGLVGAGPDFAGVALRLELPPACVVLGAAGPLSQVVINLLLNAAQAQGGAGEIQVTAAQEDEAWEIAVADRGPGLSPEVQRHLFEPFFTTKSAGKGTGLGLSISRHLVQQMGGKLSARNREGGGSVFLVRLPAVRPTSN